MRKKQRKVPVLGRNRTAGFVHGYVEGYFGHRVHVHVPQPGDYVATRRVDDLGTMARVGFVSRPDGRYTVPVDEDGLF